LKRDISSTKEERGDGRRGGRVILHSSVVSG